LKEETTKLQIQSTPYLRTSAGIYTAVFFFIVMLHWRKQYVGFVFDMIGRIW